MSELKCYAEEIVTLIIINLWTEGCLRGMKGGKIRLCEIYNIERQTSYLLQDAVSAALRMLGSHCVNG